MDNSAPNAIDNSAPTAKENTTCISKYTDACHDKEYSKARLFKGGWVTDFPVTLRIFQEPSPDYSVISSGFFEEPKVDTDLIWQSSGILSMRRNSNTVSI